MEMRSFSNIVLLSLGQYYSVLTSTLKKKCLPAYTKLISENYCPSQGMEDFMYSLWSILKIIQAVLSEYFTSRVFRSSALGR